MNNLHKKRGFTLVEIMIVVLIIGLLMAIAVPYFMKSRTSGQNSSCIENLKKIESAKEQWAMEFGKISTDTPISSDLCPSYLETYPSCPGGGTYTIGNMSTRPVCSVATHVLP